MRPVALTVIPIRARRETGRFGLLGAVLCAIKDGGAELQDGDVLVVSSKYVANSQGRMVDLGGISPSREGADLARRYRIDPEMAEIVLRESDAVLGGTAGFVLTSGGGMMAPNAGIDRSNTAGGTAVLYPEDPYGTAEALRRGIFLACGAHVGVILSDSRLMPARVGTTGVAISCAGMEPVEDARARPDLDGNPLKVTFQAVADSLASAANHGMGEAAESVPIAVLRGSGARLTGRRILPAESAVHHDTCVYVRGLSGTNP
ncbi:conserved hypothetical protein [Cenarchaeum symbiosum A]|uniref:Coenzyme F420:L-glutamate ligase-like domain-containing protein n=1 Tax=Cenarchaeum symbiosum (strain A) TaxID=414004 RepID=A0RUC6_CENSY|nr:conserved hypothetical protein [Cenarchaeum symbiosum A]